MTSVINWTRWVLLGRDDSWGATLATDRIGIASLAVLAVALHALDLATGLRMMLVHGVHLEQNPIARYIMMTSGPLGLVEVKLGVVLLGVLLFVRTAQVGRPRLARNCLLLAAGLGLLGFASNLVG
jgi:small-conductance mechanosensitive channel